VPMERVVTRLARPLLYVGIAAAVIGLAKLHATAVGSYDFTSSPRFAWAVAYIAVLALAAYGVGLPEIPRTIRAALYAAVLAAGSAGLAMSSVQVVVGDALLPRFVVIGSAMVLVPWYLFAVAFAGDARAASERRDRVLLVAEPAETGALRDELDRAAEVPAELVATIPAAVAASDGRRRPLADEVDRTAATVVVLDRVAQGEPSVVAQAADLHEGGIRVRTVSLFYEEWLGKLPVNELERVSLMFDIGEVHRTQYARISRLADVGVALIGLVGLVVVAPALALLNRWGNRGPLFFVQERVGKNGARFRMVKFRTMRPTEEADAERSWTAEDDPRVTRFGDVLRRSHVDELPQVINILKGDLAVVGPRPEQPHYVTELVDKLPFYDLRHLVRPGLTGWAQVKYGYASDDRDALEKLQYEFYYLRHQRLSLDLRIIARTIRMVAGRTGR